MKAFIILILIVFIGGLILIYNYTDDHNDDYVDNEHYWPLD